VSDAERLADILERIDRIRRATVDGRGAFFASEVVQDAVICSLEVIGDASKHVSAAVRRQHPEAPWREMSRFRDLAIHHYGKVLADEVWSIVDRDLGSIRRAIQDVSAPR
jgi:uncharacterized protein with HEPN domain